MKRDFSKASLFLLSINLQSFFVLAAVQANVIEFKIKPMFVLNCLCDDEAVLRFFKIQIESFHFHGILSPKSALDELAKFEKVIYHVANFEDECSFQGKSKFFFFFFAPDIFITSRASNFIDLSWCSFQDDDDVESHGQLHPQVRNCMTYGPNPGRTARLDRS